MADVNAFYDLRITIERHIGLELQNSQVSSVLHFHEQHILNLEEFSNNIKK